MRQTFLQQIIADMRLCWRRNRKVVIAFLVATTMLGFVFGLFNRWDAYPPLEGALRDSLPGFTFGLAIVIIGAVVEAGYVFLEWMNIYHPNHEHSRFFD